MFRTLYCKKPFYTALTLLMLGAGLIVSGLLLHEATGSMGYFALIAFGALFVIYGIVAFALYGRLEKKCCK